MLRLTTELTGVGAAGNKVRGHQSWPVLNDGLGGAEGAGHDAISETEPLGKNMLGKDEQRSKARGEIT